MVKQIDEETRANYRKAGLEPPLTAEDINAQRFEKETKNQKKTERINTLYRVRVAGKEYILYNATTIAETQLGNERTDSGVIGKRTVTRWNQKIDPATEQKIPASVSSSREEYTIPFSKQKLQEILESATAQDQEPMFYVEIPGVGSPYGGFSAHEMLTKSFDDLMYKGDNGFYPDKPIESATTPDSDTTKTLVEKKKGLLAEKGYAESDERYTAIEKEDLDKSEKKEEEEETLAQKFKETITGVKSSQEHQEPQQHHHHQPADKTTVTKKGKSTSSMR